MKKEKNLAVTRQTAEQVVRRDNLDKKLAFMAKQDTKNALSALDSTPKGLTEEQAEQHREKFGDNRVTQGRKVTLGQRLMKSFVNPFTGILFVLAIVSTITDIIMPIRQGTPEDLDPLTAIIIITMVMISGILRFVQETRSGNAASKLLAMIKTTTNVERQETGRQEIPLEEVVVGDIVHLAAGDMVPADVRILHAKDLFISQAALTGESDPQEKINEATDKKFDAFTECHNLAFMGSNVISGSATAVVVATGDDTLFGSMAQSITQEPVVTSFEKGVNAVSWVLIRFMLIMVPLVFFINGITKGDWMEAFLFGISVAVGLTPEMLPMIVTTCLAKGAVAMSKKKNHY